MIVRTWYFHRTLSPPCDPPKLRCTVLPDIQEVNNLQLFEGSGLERGDTFQRNVLLTFESLFTSQKQQNAYSWDSYPAAIIIFQRETGLNRVEACFNFNNNCNFYSAFFMLNMIKCAIQSSLPKKGKLPLGTSLHITHSQSLTRQQQQQQQQ